MSYRLSDFGSYHVGGRCVDVAGEPVREIWVTPSTHYPYDVETPELGDRGNTHMLMMVDNSESLAGWVVGWLRDCLGA